MAAVRALRLAATMASFAAADLSKLKPPKAGHVRLYLCRHGQTDWNAAKRIQGSVDKELNAMGHRQAALIGEALAGVPLQARGRKPVIMVASCFYCLGSLTVAAARGFGELVAGRVVLGLGVGLSSMAIPVYVAEASPAELRGRLVSCYNLFIVLGQAAACGVNIVCGTYLGTSSRWRVSMGVAAAPAGADVKHPP